MTMMQEITVRVLKHDGAEYRRWNAKRSRCDQDLIILDAVVDVDESHELLGESKRRTKTGAYY